MNNNDSYRNENRYQNDLPDLLKKQSYTKYPLVNNPNTPLKNMNYKDWLNTYDPEGISLVSPQPYSATWYNVIAAVLAVTAVVLALSNPVTLAAAIAAGAGITAALLPIIWPQGEDNALFNDMMWVTTDMLDQSLSGLVQAQANALLSSLRNELEAYQRALVNWQNNQQSQPAINEVVHRYHTTNSQFRTIIPQFALEGYQSQLLPIYAIAANLHLLHMRDGVQYADYWSLARSDTDTDDTDASVFNGDFQYQELLHFMDIYSEYCTSEYWRSLSIMEAAVDKNQGWDWTRYNDFRNLMTTSVLDYVALFPMYDIRIYNTRLNMEILTRKLYSHPINFLPRNEKVQQVDAKYTLPPNLYQRLIEINCHTSGINNQFSTYFLSGHTNRYARTDGRTSGGNFYGIPSNISLTKALHIGSYQIGIAEIKAYSLRRTVSNPTNSIPSSIIQKHFIFPGGGAQSYFSNNPTPDPIEATTSIPNHKTSDTVYTDNNHYLDNMIIADQDNTPGLAPIDQIKSYSYSWHHGSIKFKNILEPSTMYGLQSNTFSIIKASNVIGASIIEGFSHTGGDVVLSKFQNPNTGTRNSIIDFPFDLEISQTWRYQIRLRYASNSAVNISTILNFASGPTSNQVNNVNPTFNHNSTANLTIKDFSYITLGEFFLYRRENQNNVRINIIHPPSQITGDSLFIIDKIEFISF
ncbi:insecticidal delta-endotoxin Cry8Ea1 family protein [Lysinibacillus sp. VIII_CA]|uniref:insecticidal delta-endotoxin Cry8Ea1 family protein n=1 Tax=Lysinibacillus sp. VIII_CA TaxID=3417452 RepID=UPI003CE76254